MAKGLPDWVELLKRNVSQGEGHETMVYRYQAIPRRTIISRLMRNLLARYLCVQVRRRMW